MIKSLVERAKFDGNSLSTQELQGSIMHVKMRLPLLVLL